MFVEILCTGFTLATVNAKIVKLSSAVNKEWHSHVAEEGYNNEANITQCGPKY